MHHHPCKLSIIVPIFNSSQHLKMCLDSIVQAICEYGHAELILVDNGSTDGSFEILHSEYAEVAKIYQLRGVSISALRNYGTRAATGGCFSFIDSDCVVPRDYFCIAMDVLASTGADAAGGNYALPESPHWIEETWDYLSRVPVKTYVPYLPAGNFLVKKRAFQTVGGFDESLITGEDTELGLRLTSAGFIIFSSPQLSVIHLGNPKDIFEFFKKQIWQGLGMFGTFKHSSFDKPVLMTFTHLFLILAGLMSLFVGPGRTALRIAAFVALAEVVPVLGVIHRYGQRRSVYHPLRSILLYSLYFAARLCALVKILVSSTSAPRARSSNA